jgi:hypothetical protein
VSPIYYVTFTTAVLTASFILFQGFNITDGVKTMSLLCGFLIIFSGVYLLNYPANNLDGHEVSDERYANGPVTQRASMVHSRSSLQHSPLSSEESQSDDRTRLMQSYGEESDGYMLQRIVPDGSGR